MTFATLSRPQGPLMDVITAALRRDEKECVSALLPQAARACFDAEFWPDYLPVPQAGA